MEEQPYAARMQEEMIAEIEKQKPDYVVYVQDDYSWLPRPNSQRRIFEWWEQYWAGKLDLVKTVDVTNGREVELGARPDSRDAQSRTR